MFLRNYKKTALKWKNTDVSYADLLKKITYYATLFSNTNKRVLIFSENRPEWIYSFYGSWKNNCTVIPIDYLSTVEEVTYIVQDSSPEVFFCSREREPILRKVAKHLDYSPHILVYEDIENIDTTPDKGQVEQNLDEPDLNDTALIIYTSGTTGDPKGVMLSYENILANIEAVTLGVPIFSIDERVMLLLPLHHIFPLLGSLVAPLYVGSTIAFSPSMVRDPLEG